MSYLFVLILALVTAVQGLRHPAADEKASLIGAEDPDQPKMEKSALPRSNPSIFANGTDEFDDMELSAEPPPLPGYPPWCRQFVQWTFERPSTKAKSSLGLDDVAIGLISGQPEFFDVAHRNILQYAERGVLIKAKGRCPCSFRAALRALWHRFPGAEWYYIGDEDAIIDLSNLVALLRQYDPALPTLVAANSKIQTCEHCGACPEISDQDGLTGTTNFYGGTGQIYSRGLVEAMAPSLQEACTEAETPTLRGFGDLESSCAIVRSWRPSWRLVRLQRRILTWDKFSTRKPEFFVAHHLCPELLAELGHINRNLTTRHPKLMVVDNADNNGC